MKDAQPRTIWLKDYRPPAFLIPQTELVVRLHDDCAEIETRLHITRNPASETRPDHLRLDGEELELLSIALDDQPLPSTGWTVTADSLVVYNIPDTFVLTTRSRIRPQDNTRLEGLYRSGKMFCTQCEAEGFRRITWYLDRPDVLSVFTTRIEADRRTCPVLLSNGNPIGTEELEGDRHAATWHDPFPKPCYLFALVAGDLVARTDHFTTCSGRKVTLNIYVEPENIDKCDFALDALKRAMRWDEEKYGREYDLDLFNIVAVNDFNMGAMENKGLNIFNSSCVLARPDATTDEGFERIEAIIAHEYFHNWSGNRVTCRDWFQLSLKEGFTVFRDAQFTADMHSPTVKRIDDVNLLRSAQFAEDSGPMAHPVRPDSYIEISNFYTLTVYEKGAEVVRMLHTLLGAALFRKGTDLYFERFDGQAVTTDDFVACMEEVSGRDLTQFRRWYTQAGTPRLGVTDEWDPVTGTYTLNFRQTCPPTPGQPAKAPFHIPVRMALLGEEGRLLPLDDAGTVETCIEVTEPEQKIVFRNLPSRPVPSLLREFSAPVILEYDWSEDQLTHLIRFDTDGFNRWDAMQTLAIQTIRALLEKDSARSEHLLATWTEAVRGCLARADEDAALTARLIQLPSVSWLRDQFAPCDIQALVAVHEQAELSLAQALKVELEAIYRRYRDTISDDLGSEAMAGRAIMNQALLMLAAVAPQTVLELADAQIQSARTLSSELGGLKAMLRCGHCEKTDSAVSAFYRKWQGDLQVMELWFSAQAGESAWSDLERIRELTLHPAFSDRHPNSVRAVIGRFAAGNWKHFHRQDGDGYRWLAEWVGRLDRLNPQLAARIVTPLTQWKKYAGPYAKGMVEALKLIQAQPGLSRDVYEIVSKSLADSQNRTLD